MKTIVISLGGSQIIQDKVNLKYLQNFKKVLQKTNKKFVVVTGGGTTARTYIKPLRDAGLKEFDQNTIGIECTRLNAHLVKLLFGDRTKVPTTTAEVKKQLKKQKVVICGGLHRGTTSDGTSAEIAKYLKAEMFINITNVKGLYTKDPRKYKSAKFIPEISYDELWNKFLKKMKYKPGQHFIIDQTALKTLRKAKIQSAVVKSLKDLEKCIKGKRFTGTIIT